MVSTICHKSDNENFYARISDSILINELVEELTEFSLPINGYKHQLQARLQLAYLGVQASEHEEKIGSWFKLKLGQLQAECKDRKISDKGSKADLRRKLCMHLCGIEDGISPANLTPAAPPRTSQMEDIVHQNPVVQTSQMEDLFHQNPVAQTSQMASALQIPASNVATIQEALARSFGSTTMAPQVADVVDQTPASTHVQLALAPTSQVTDAVHQTLGLTAITPQQALVPQTSQVTGGSHQTPANATEQTLQSVLARIVSLEDNKSPVQGSSVTVELGSTTSEPSASQLIVRKTESCTAPQLATPQALSRKRDSLTTSPSVPSSGNASTTKAACTTAAASMDQAHGDLVSQSSTSTPSTLTKPKSKPTAPTQTTLTTKSTTGSKFTQPILHSLENVLWAAKGPLINQLRPVDQMYLDALTAHFYDKFMARLFDASKTEGN